MLNKELCQRCWKKYDYWDDHNPAFWKKDYNFCPAKMDKIKINKKPPNNCPYILEYIVQE